jgi:hypothetical protein
MFLQAVNTLLMEALQNTFDAEYPTADFRGLWVSMEYPADRANYPGIWVDFETTADLQIAGIGHTEYTVPEGRFNVRRKTTRWRFAGMATFTVAAMTSLERARLADELVRVLAFGSEDPATSDFRSYIEHNDLIATQMQWDKFSLNGKAETPGTPWGTDDVIYEITVTVDCQGEFISDGTSGTLVPLSAIVITDTVDDTIPAGLGPGASGSGGAADPTDWH